jgi:demethylmenaquinone methyltransferase/2-methoxy-6-polyprenyl-1,4-benzoquinol methylase
MFDAIAPRYDLLNRVMAANMDQRWRRRAARVVTTGGAGRGAESGGDEGRVFLDVGAGTGDLTLAVSRAAPGARVLGIDLARAMLAEGQRKRERAGAGGSRVELVQASGLAIPARDSTFDGITNAFVLRNLADLDAFFREAHRALKPGGKLVSLEISRPPGKLFGPLYRWYFFRVMPRMGRALSGNKTAYSYLATSVEKVETPAQLAARMTRAGFETRATPLMRGAVVLFEATRR